jgi:putative membrane protein
MDKSAEQDPRVYFAAERTFLAWIRTGLGLMGIGFAVSRFGIFLREFSSTKSNLAVHSRGFSEWSGVALVALGVIVNVAALLQHISLVRELSTGTWTPGRLSKNAVILALLLAGAGVGMAAYLILVNY